MKPVGAHHRDHPPEEADLPGTAHRQAGDGKSHPQADPVRGVVPQDAQAPIPDHRQRVGARLGRRVVLCRDLDDAALRRRGAAGDPCGDGEQHPAEMGRSSSIPTSTCTLRPRWNGRWRSACSRSKDVIIVGDIPAGPSDPSIDDPTRARPMRTASPSASTPRGRSASRSPRSPTCPAGRISRCPNWKDGGKMLIVKKDA